MLASDRKVMPGRADSGPVVMLEEAAKGHVVTPVRAAKGQMAMPVGGARGPAGEPEAVRDPRPHLPRRLLGNMWKRWKKNSDAQLNAAE